MAVTYVQDCAAATSNGMRTQAVILKKILIREYDELIVCYTQESGKQVYQAKSIMLPTSKQAGHLDILNFVDFSLVQKNGHPIITSAYCLEVFPRLKSSLPAMSAAYFLLECFDKLVFEGESDAKLWDFLLTQLRKLDEEPMLDNLAHSRLSNTIAFMRQELLKIMGYDPSMPIEQLANSQFKSLHFARSMLK